MGLSQGSYQQLRTSKGGSIAEFGPVLFILLVVVFLPLVGFFSFASGCATLYFATITASRNAMPALTGTDAMTNTTNTFNQIISGPFGTFGGIGTSTNSPALSLVTRSVTTGDTVSETPGTGSKPFAGVSVNSTNNFYQYKVTSTNTIKPLFYPGGPITMSFTDIVTVEHPEGLPN